MDDTPRQPRLPERGYLPVASGIGFYEGFFGPGTGQFFAATLVAARGLGLIRATGLTKLLNLASNAASLAVFAAGGQVIWLLGLCMGAGSMVGALIGTRLANPAVLCSPASWCGTGSRIDRPQFVSAHRLLGFSHTRRGDPP